MSYLGRNIFGEKVYTSAVVMSLQCFRMKHTRCKRAEKPLYQDVRCQCACHNKVKP